MLGSIRLPSLWHGLRVSRPDRPTETQRVNPHLSLSIPPDGTTRLREESSDEGSIPSPNGAGCSTGRVVCQIPSDSAVVAAYVEIWNDVETIRHRVDVPTDVGRNAEKGPWFVTKSWHEYIGGTRVFTAYVENQSQTSGCRFQLHVTFEMGRRR